MQKNHSQDITSKNDHSRYLVSLCAKDAAAKQALWAIYAFNHEVAKTREIVSDTTLGLIRLTWWREAINHIYGKPTEQKRTLDDHPILQELAFAVNTFDLEYDHFQTILLGREFDLEDVQPQNINGLLTYLDNTNLPLLKLTAQICDLEIGTDIKEENLQNLARANGLAGLLRAIPFHAQHNLTMLPSDLIAKNDVLKANETTLPDAIKTLFDTATKEIEQPKAFPKGPLKAFQNFLGSCSFMFAFTIKIMKPVLKN